MAVVNRSAVGIYPSQMPPLIQPITARQLGAPGQMIAIRQSPESGLSS